MGLSRNGKQSLWTAAFDERINAVIDCGSGTGGITTWRYSDPQYVNETIDAITSNFPQWFHPRLRFFFGREDRLPVDQNLFLSLIAPRALLFHYSVMEKQHNPWVNEHTYQSVKKVYSFLGAENKLSIYPRVGEHFTSARDVERCIDFLDIQFNRKKLPWENNLLFFSDSFASWAAGHTADKLEAAKIKAVKLQDKYADTAAYKAQKTLMLNNLKWLLGKEPSGVKPDSIGKEGAQEIDWIDNITGRPVVTGAVAQRLGPNFPASASMGDFLKGMLYYPADK